MKIHIFIGIICLISFTQCNFYDSLLTYVNKMPIGIPSNSGKYIKNMNTYVDVLSNTIKKDKISRLGELGVPKHAVDNFVRTVKHGNETSFTYVSVNSNSNVIGIGKIEVQGEKARYAYLEAHSSGTLIPQKENHRYRKCKGWWIFKKCWWEDNWVVRKYTIAELEVIKNALRGKSLIDLRSKVVYLKNLSPNVNFIMELKGLED